MKLFDGSEIFSTDSVFIYSYGNINIENWMNTNIGRVNYIAKVATNSTCGPM